MLEDMKEQRNMLESIVDMLVEHTYGLELKVKANIENIEMEKFDEYTLSDFTKILSIDDYSSLCDIVRKSKENECLDDVDCLKYVAKEIKKELDNLDEVNNEIIEFEEERNAIAKDYIDYLNSPEYKESRKARMKEMHDTYEKEEDPIKKERLLKTINAIKSMDSLSFLFKRFHNNEAQEKKSVMDSFFDTTRGNYVLGRFNTVCKGLKISPDIYIDFINLEETYLPEKYHVYNNLFLFFSMRYIAYTNLYNNDSRAFATALMMKINKLFYNSFADENDKTQFMQVVTDVLDYFEDEREVFIEKNMTHPNHPVRISHANRDDDTSDDTTLDIDGPIIMLPNTSYMGLNSVMDDMESTILHQK